MTAPAFPTDYVSSRARFREAATRLGWTLHAHPVAGAGPAGEDLTIDAAVSPAPGADRVLIASSALHGVEGPFGAAVQLAVLDGWAKAGGPPAGVRAVFLHGLNPWGYAWGRRVDEVNVDPNRNFLLDGQEYRGSPDAYHRFNALLNPERPPGRWDPFLVRAWLSVARHGLPALKQALVGGQYDYPKGIFFGGPGPSTTHLALRERFAGWVGAAARAVHLDFHTGLGRWGTYKLLLDSPLPADHRIRMDKWFGPGTYEEDDPRGVAYLPRGGFGPWCVGHGGAADYLYMVAEFGTYAPVPMLAGLRAENRAWHWGRRGDVFAERARARLRELFCPTSPEWRARVLAQGVELVNRAVTRLAAAG